MIGEIGQRYRMFMNNTGNINTTDLTIQIRAEFHDYFEPAEDYVQERIKEHNKIYNGKSYHSQERACRYFKIADFKAAVIDFAQDHTRFKGRDYRVELIDYNNNKERKHMVPFIKFYCNPIGIYLLEKIWFRSV